MVKKEIAEVLAEAIAPMLVMEAAAAYDIILAAGAKPPVEITKEQFIVGYGIGVMVTMKKVEKALEEDDSDLSFQDRETSEQDLGDILFPKTKGMGTDNKLSTRYI